MQAAKNFFGFCSNENARFFAFAILKYCKNSKKAFTEADGALEIKQFCKHGCHNRHRCSQNLQPNEAKNLQKIKNSQPQLEIYWFL